MIVTARVWGMTLTSKPAALTRLTVRLTPSTAIEPLAAIYRARAAGTSIAIRQERASVSIDSTVATASTWP
jgi:hypothetical protein